MRKRFIAILFGLTALTSYAQTAYDAFLFSKNDYYGTARTVAMGNAFTALGGDLGSLTLNPAGSAVAEYSQVTISPSLNIASTTSQGVPYPGGGKLSYFQDRNKSSLTNFNLSNAGATLMFDLGRSSGLKHITFGIVANQTGSWGEDVYASGTNNMTSMMGAMAYEASNYYGPGKGILSQDLSKSTLYDPYNHMPWIYVVAYNSGMISTFGDYDDQYVGTSEVILDNNDIVLGGPLNQGYGRSVEGNKYDYLINLGMNISDIVYVGVNLGIVTMDYAYNEYFREIAQDPNDFGIILDNDAAINFSDMTYQYGYVSSGVGYYGKLGVIVTPGFGLRLGAAIQTPTENNIKEEWRYCGETNYTDRAYNAREDSGWGFNEYRLISPFRANFGVAWTLGGTALVSADYELCDYGTMKFASAEYYSDDWSDVNRAIRNTYGLAHQFRLGAEVKPLPELAIRAGYGFDTFAERAMKGAVSEQNISFGLGYSSRGSFFADLAARTTLIPTEYYMPYIDYIVDEGGSVIDNAYSPEIGIDKSLWKVVLTLGWRF